MTHHLGFDFGTSNTATAYLRDGQVVRVQMMAGAETIPTAVFFDYGSKKMVIGSDANTALFSGQDGRYMRSLKSVLGTSLMHEKQVIAGKRLDFFDIISDFIGRVKQASETYSGHEFKHAIAGRPVFFHRANQDANATAVLDLEKCYHLAGFETVTFVPEPEAAALASADLLDHGNLGLVVDIGGGTSDFSVFRMGDRGIEILASNGLRLGGTDFDRAINFNEIMPHLGKGKLLHPPLGAEPMPAPVHIYADLATWEKIPFLYQKKTLDFARGMTRDAVDKRYFERLEHVLENHLGHDISFLAERAKIEVNAAGDDVILDAAMIADRARIRFKSDRVRADLADYGTQLQSAILETLAAAGVHPDQLATVIPVGGSCLMHLVRDAITRALPNAVIKQGDAFTSIVDGLALNAKK